MNTKSFFSITLAIILMFGCKSSDNSLVHFDPRNLEENEITLSEIGDEVSYIPFDNTYPLSMVSNIEFINSNIYLNSKNIGILVFDRKGEFINRIGSIGRGPGEYIVYLSFCIDDRTGTVYVRDAGNIVKVFSNTGQFIRSFSLKEYGDAIENIGLYNSKLFIKYALQFQNANYKWIFCDTLGNVFQKKERQIPLFITNWGGSRPIYMFENKLSYYDQFTDTVFSILPELIEKPSIIISPGEHRLPRSYLSPEQLISDKYLHIIKIFETHRFFVINYSYNKFYLALIEKHDHASFLIDLKLGNSNYLNGIKNDIDGGQFFIPEYYFTEKGREYMVGLFDSYQLKTMVASNEFKNSVPRFREKKKELEKLAYKLKETDNPVLMIVRLKK